MSRFCGQSEVQIMLTQIIIAVFLLSPARASYCDIAPEMRQRMGLPQGTCKPLTVKPTEVEAAFTWCCGLDGTPCVPVNYVHDCDPMCEYAVVCDWGQCNDDGTITCYG